MMKKFFATLAACALAIGTLTGCGGDKPPEPSTGSGKATIGIITHLNASEEKYNEVMQKLEKSYRPSKAHLSANYKYFGTLIDMQFALKGGQIDMLSTYQCVSKFMLSRSKDLELLPSERNLSDDFCFAVREGDTRLKNDLNKAIKSMTDDGTLAHLTKKYILDIDGNDEPVPIEIEKIDGADTIKVAVTGDLPPLDWVNADGTPSGFSTAVLAEISKRMGKNIELVQIDSGARAVALTSKKVDVVFWVSVPRDSTLIPANIDKPTGIELSEPYYTDSITHIGLKK